MGRRGRIIGLNIALGVVGLLVLGLGWQLVKRIQIKLIPTQQAVSAVDQYPPAEDIYQIEIRNGAGVSGAAEALRSYLIEKGYDVVEVGNHRSFDVEKTQVVDRVGNLSIARQVASSLGLTEEHVLQQERQDYFLDASVIIGKDYLILPPFAEGAVDTSAE